MELTLTRQPDLPTAKHEQERLFCACVLASPDIAVNSCSWLPVSAFTDQKLGKFWNDVKQHGDSIKAANDHGLTTELAGWINRTPNVTTPEVYAKGIAEHKYLVDTLVNSSKVAKAAVSRDIQKVKQIVGDMQTSDVHKPVTLHTGSTLNRELGDVLDGKVESYIKTYVGTIDNALGGSYAGDLFMLAARPGMGKTALATVVGRNAAFSGKRVFFFSLEMMRVQLWGRMVCGHVGYKWRDVRVGDVDEAGKKKIRALSEKIQHRLGDRFVVFDDLFTVGEIVQACVQGKPDFVIIDHLGEIDWDNPNDSEVRWYGKAAHIFRTYIAKRLSIPLWLIHQLSRDVEVRGGNKRPQLRDLRWSGELEQRSDVVGFIYREDYYLDAPIAASKVPCELIIRKNRQGKANTTIMMEYDLDKQDFKSWVDI